MCARRCVGKISIFYPSTHDAFADAKTGFRFHNSFFSVQARWLSVVVDFLLKSSSGAEDVITLVCKQNGSLHYVCWGLSMEEEKFALLFSPSAWFITLAQQTQSKALQKVVGAF